MNLAPGICRRLDWICRVTIGVTLGGAVVGLPWWYGGVRVESQHAVAVALCIASLAAVVRAIVSPATHFASSQLAIPAILVTAIGLGLLQLKPLSPSLLGWFSPQSVAWQDAMPQVGPAEWPAMGTLSSRPLSLAPSATRHHVALLCLATVAFLLAQSAFDDSVSRWGILVVYAGNGAAFAFFGIIQQLTSPGKLYWRIELPEGAVPFAGYVNRNNAAGYLNIVLAGAFGLLVWAVVRHRFNVVQPTAHGGSRRPPRRQIQLTEWLANTDGWTIMAMTTVVATLAGLMSSLSRGGVLATVVAGIVSFGLLSQGQRNWRRSLGIGLCAMAVIFVAVWIGNGQQLQRRFGQLLQPDGWQQDSRLVHWRTGWQAAQHFWRAGSGLGSYRFVYEPFEDRNETQWYHHAENQYLEALVELGFIGPCLLFAACGATWLAVLRLLRKASDAETYALSIACFFALISQVVQAIFDFGLYLPANAMALAVLCGTASLAPPSRRRYLDDSLSHPPSRVDRTVPLLVACTVFVMAGVSVYMLRDLLIVERIERHAPDPVGYHPAQQPLIQSQIEQLQQLVHRHPTDAHVHTLLAQLWTLRYRIEATRSLDKQLGGNADVQQLWAFTDPVWMHARVYQLEQERAPAALEQLRAQPALRNSLGPAFSHLLMARHVQPMRAKHELAVAELLPLLASTHSDAAHLEYAVNLSPCQAEVLFRAGVLHLQAHRRELGIVLWRRCLAVSHAYRRQIFELGPQLVGPVDFFEQLFQGLPGPLVDIAFEHYSSPDHFVERLQLADLAETQLSQQPQSAVEELVLRARIAWLREELPTAESFLRNALQLSPDSLDLHYDLARLLLRRGDLAAARQHAARCLSAQPTNPRFRKLMRDLRATQR